jgi:hypothetical protein
MACISFCFVALTAVIALRPTFILGLTTALATVAVIGLAFDLATAAFAAAFDLGAMTHA